MKRLITSIFALALTVVSFAQDIIVTMTPTQQYLPPQTLLYLTHPEYYFNISLLNTTSEPKQVYLGMNLQQVSPSTGVSVRVGAGRQPETPFVVPANGSYQLTMVDMMKLFDHVPSSEVQTSEGLFSNYANGSLGLLPEGDYEAQIVAYQWNPALKNPVAVSNLIGGKCTFTICYKAQAPRFLMPIATNVADLNQVAELDPALPQFTWTAPIVACNPSVSNFQYKIKIVGLLEGQSPNEALEKNPVVYQSTSPLVSPMFLIPTTVVNQMSGSVTYAAQVTASMSNLQSTYLNYALIENDGKSSYLLFKVKKEVAAEPEPEPEKEEEGSGDGLRLGLGGQNEWEADSTKLYTFRNPEITRPVYAKDEKRKAMVYSEVPLEWKAAWYVGGLGAEPDTLKMEYHINIYKADHLIETYNEIEEYCKNNEPVYKKVTPEISETIPYSELDEHVTGGDHLYLRIDPVCTNETSIAYVDSLCNRTNWMLVDLPTSKYFQCSNSIEIDNLTPTTKKAAQLQGTTVTIGEYNLKLDKIDAVKGAKGCFKGTGHVEWRPMGYKLQVAVAFDSLCINTDNQVFAGQATTYERPEMKANSASINDMFTDLGLNDWASDLGVPFGNDVDTYTMGEAAKAAEKYDISKYYEYVKTGKGVWDDITSGESDDVYLPLKVPKSINKSPIDVQIFNATFAPQWAKMNIIGEFTLPESDYTKDNVLILTAPRLCISPDELLPESGTLALMKDFTVIEPKSGFEFTFNAPDDLESPTKGCFVSWKDYSLEMLDIDVSMLIPNVKKVDASGKKTEENPVLNFHATIEDWEKWRATGTMDNFMSEDLDGWIFMPGEIVYDHDDSWSATGFKIPADYDRDVAGLKTKNDNEWQGLYIADMGIVFPKMLNVDDQDKSWQGHLRLEASKILIDGSGISLDFGAKDILKLNTGSLGGWGLSMEELMLNITQNKFRKCWFKGDIKTPLDGLIGYKCDMVAQGKEEGRAPGEEGFVYIFATQQIKELKMDFWLAEMEFDKEQTYFLIEAESYANREDDDVKVELCLGGKMSITIGRKSLESLGKVGSYINAQIPDLHITGLRLANCPRWTSKHLANLGYDFKQVSSISEFKSEGKSLNDYFGFKEEYNFGDPDSGNGFFFSLGRWSLASEEKSIGEGGGFKFGLSDYGIDLNGNNLELYLQGNVKFADFIDAKCGIAIMSEVDFNKWDLNFNGVEFRDATIATNFAGIKIKGTLKVSTGANEGYAGELEMSLPGDLFELKGTGGYYTNKDEGYSWGFFTAEAKSTVGIRLDPIVINGIKGGFYFNCKPKAGADPTNLQETNPQCEKGSIGFMIGMVICTSAGEETLKADMDLTVVFNTKTNSLSSFTMNGNLSAVGGMVNGKAQLVYNDDENSRYFDLSISVSGKGALVEADKKLFENFKGTAMPIAEKIEQGLGSLTEEDQKEETSTEASKTNKHQYTSDRPSQVSLNFRIEHFKSGDKAGKTKWHLYIGEPDYDKRCRLTLIDFQAGKKSDRWAMWAYLGSNMYFCLGNELPNDGQLPALPERVSTFLNGKDVNGESQAGNSSKAKANSDSAVKDMIAMANSAGCEGGIMVGACAEGDFGVNAGIVYAHAYSCYGFDVMLKKLTPGTKCRGGGSMGFHNWYGMGQAYAVLEGDIGVHVDLWFIKKDISIVEVGVGALIQAGLPNPTWVFGKARARLSLLGGLFKFNRSIEIKAGKVCYPDYGDPLDNIKIVETAQPGDSIKSEGYKDVCSVYSVPRFTTNFVIGKEVVLVDKNKQDDYVRQYEVTDEQAAVMAGRKYRFIIESVKFYYDNGQLFSTGQWRKADEGTNFNVFCKSFEPNTSYYMEIVSRAEEYDKSGKWSNPIINGKSQRKEERARFYFRTGKLSEDVSDEIVYSLPKKGVWDEVREEDMKQPYICLEHFRDDLAPNGYDSSTDGSTAAEVKYGYRWVLYKNGERFDTRPNYVQRREDFENWLPYTPFVFPDKTAKYKVALVRYNKGAGVNSLNTNKKSSIKRSVLVDGNGMAAAGELAGSISERNSGNTQLADGASSSSFSDSWLNTVASMDSGSSDTSGSSSSISGTITSVRLGAGTISSGSSSSSSSSSRVNAGSISNAMSGSSSSSSGTSSSSSGTSSSSSGTSSSSSGTSRVNAGSLSDAMSGSSSSSTTPSGRVLAGSVSSASENYADRMREFFAQEDADEDPDRFVETTTAADYTDQVAIAEQEREMFSITADKLVDGTFASGSLKCYPYEEVYMAATRYANKYDVEMGRNNLACVQSETWKNNPWSIMTYFANYAFLGGQEFRPYAYSGLVYGAADGLRIDLEYPTQRADDAFISPTILSQYATSINKFRTYWPFLNARGVGYENTSVILTDYQYCNDDNLFDNDNIHLTTLHRKTLRAIASDAFSTYLMLNKIRSEASLFTRSVKYAYDKWVEIGGKPSEWRGAMGQFNDEDNFNSQASMKSAGYKLLSKSPDISAPIFFNTFSFSVPWMHFFLMSNMAGYPAPKFDKVQNVVNFKANYPYRFNDAVKVWDNVRNFTFDYEKYLKGYTEFQYVLWRVDVYNINKRRKELYKGEKNKRSVSVKNPFSYYNFSNLK